MKSHHRQTPLPDVWVCACVCVQIQADATKSRTKNTHLLFHPTDKPIKRQPTKWRINVTNHTHDTTHHTRHGTARPRVSQTFQLDWYPMP
mmetsp:Transcript_50449/g.126420  ORF Transcript_50449/g.126420 Transcript_50449/m.126420 type:complete len:90 (+) Transcript_50449:951-1220(+)